MHAEDISTLLVRDKPKKWCDYLCETPDLDTLVISHDQSDDAIKWLAHGVEQNKSLKTLRVLAPMIRRQWLPIIVALEAHPKVETLELHYTVENDIDACIFPIARLMVRNPRIKTLLLSGNQNSMTGEEVLCWASGHLRHLSICKTLVVLEPFALLLKNTPTLRSLALCSVFLGDDDAALLAQALRVNFTLRHLDVSNNKELGEAGWLALVTSLEESNFTLTQLQGHDMPPTVRGRLDTALCRNAAIRHAMGQALMAFVGCCTKRRARKYMDKNLVKIICGHVWRNAREWDNNQ